MSREPYKLFLSPKTNKQALTDISDNYSSPPGIISRLHPLIFQLTPGGLSLSKRFVEFLSNLYVTLCFGKIFKFMVLRLLENAFVIQNIEYIHF